MSAKTMQTLQEIMKFEGYMDIAAEEFKHLKQTGSRFGSRPRTFQRRDQGPDSKRIVKRYYYKKGVLIYTLQKTKCIKSHRGAYRYRHISQHFATNRNSLAETFLIIDLTTIIPIHASCEAQYSSSVFHRSLPFRQTRSMINVSLSPSGKQSHMRSIESFNGSGKSNHGHVGNQGRSFFNFLFGKIINPPRYWCHLPLL